MYVSFWGSLYEAYGGHQNRHLGQENEYRCFRDRCMGYQRYIHHPRQVPFSLSWGGSSESPV